ncbi:MAG: hypothetical protein HY904_13195 [Deltaproteobacteria bacterium]|nr:hypothetical protein [Deltaproteobacteria bacterium]
MPLLASGILLVSGCASLNLGTFPVASRARLGKPPRGTPTEGSACAFVILGLIPVREDALRRAYDEALQEAGPGHRTLRDVAVTVKKHGFSLNGVELSWHCYSLEAMAVRDDDPDGAGDPDDVTEEEAAPEPA